MFVCPSEASASRTVAALHEFGIGEAGLTASIFSKLNHVIQLG